MMHGYPEQKEVRLVRNVGTGAVLLLGIGSLLGGGIFTLLGPAISYAGAAVLVALALNAVISFLNLQMYASLASTIPAAGGGNQWVRMGLGNFQGFIAGWISWLAQASACGLYALSGGFYAYHFLFSLLGFPQPVGMSIETFEKVAALSFLIIFGWINWKSNKSTQYVGGVIVVLLLAILLLFVISGFIGFSVDAQTLWANNFSDFFGMGLAGILSASALFYIAFEGSEIQAQTGEEVRNPKDLKKALFGSWGIVCALYFLVAFVMLANGPLSDVGEGAIVVSAESFMPLGVLLMTLAGIFANLAAFNATIYSSSRLAFSLARDHSILSHLSHIHAKNFTPDWAVLVSLVLVAAMVVSLPLVAVGAAASLLFIILFLQLNIAGIAIRRQHPDIKWQYRIRGYPFTTVAAVVLYALLAFSMFFFLSAAWWVALTWILIGVINYFAYTKRIRHESFEKEILYERALRLGEKKAHRVLLPVSSDVTVGELEKLVGFSWAFARHWEAELIAVIISTRGAENIEHHRHILFKVEEFVAAHNKKIKSGFQVDTHTYILSSKSVVETILEIVREENCDILMLTWDGYVRSKGKVFGSKIDPVLRRTECDLVVFKTDAIVRPASILVPVGWELDSQFLRFAGKATSALWHTFKSSVTIFTAIPPAFKHSSDFERWEKELLFNIRSKVKLDADIPWKLKVVEHTSPALAIIDESKTHDLLVMGASRERVFQEIRMGNIPEFVAKHVKKPVVIAKGYRGITQPFIDYVKDRFRM